VSLQALDALGSLTGGSGNGSNAIGDAVCRLGADAIVPALNETLQILRGQCPDVLAGLGPLTAGLGRVDPKVVSVSGMGDTRVTHNGCSVCMHPRLERMGI
jgi:hypothetical protein